MTDLDAIPFAPPDSRPNLGAAPRRKCRRHEWVTLPEWAISDSTGRAVEVSETSCIRCGAIRDEASRRRGRSSLRAGKDAERAIAKAYPEGKRTGQFGGPDDVQVGEMFVIQSKAGGWFSERYWNELAKLPRTGGRIPTLVVSDRPGPGHRTRRLVVRTLDDDVALHGSER